MKSIEQMIAENTLFDPIRKLFYRRVCKAGLFERIDEVDQRGMSAAFGDIELRTYVIAGRTMITIEEGDKQITFLTDDRERNEIELHTTEGDYKKVMDMINAVMGGWPDNTEDQRDIFKANSNIQIG